MIVALIVFYLLGVVGTLDVDFGPTSRKELWLTALGWPLLVVVCGVDATVGHLEDLYHLWKRSQSQKPSGW